MKIIGFVGFKGSGKDTAAQPLIDSGFKKTSFASKLKDCCSVIFGWDRQMLEGTDGESRLKREETDLWWAEKLGKPGFSPRRAFQQIGTDAIRSHFHPNIWVLATQKQIVDSNDDWVITDCRFPNELQMVKDLGGTLVRIKRGPDPDWFNDAVLANTLLNDKGVAAMNRMAATGVHVSEWAWIGSNLIDYTIENNGSEEELYEQVLHLCQK